MINLQPLRKECINTKNEPIGGLLFYSRIFFVCWSEHPWKQETENIEIDHDNKISNLQGSILARYLDSN